MPGRAKGPLDRSAGHMNVPMPLALAWRKDNKSRLLASFVVNVQRFLVPRRASGQ
jgi:hypothetical protein